MKFAGHFDKERGVREEGEVDVEVEAEGRGYNRNYYAFIYLDAFSYVLVLLLFIYFLSFFQGAFSEGECYRLELIWSSK